MENTIAPMHYRCWCSEPFWDPLRPGIEFQTGFVYMIYAALTAVWLQPLMHSNETMNMLLKEEGDETSESWFVVSLPAAEDWFHYSLSTHKGVSILMALEQEILMLLCGFLNSEQIKQWASCHLPTVRSCWLSGFFPSLFLSLLYSLLDTNGKLFSDLHPLAPQLILITVFPTAWTPHCMWMQSRLN